jgi:hypothetical protein
MNGSALSNGFIVKAYDDREVQNDSYAGENQQCSSKLRRSLFIRYLFLVERFSLKYRISFQENTIFLSKFCVFYHDKTEYPGAV